MFATCKKRTRDFESADGFTTNEAIEPSIKNDRSKAN